MLFPSSLSYHFHLRWQEFLHPWKNWRLNLSLVGLGIGECMLEEWGSNMPGIAGPGVWHCLGEDFPLYQQNSLSLLPPYPRHTHTHAQCTWTGEYEWLYLPVLTLTLNEVENSACPVQNRKTYLFLSGICSSCYLTFGILLKVHKKEAAVLWNADTPEKEAITWGGKNVWLLATSLKVLHQVAKKNKS